MQNRKDTLVAMLDNDTKVLGEVTEYLGEQGFKTAKYSDADAFLEFVRKTVPEVVVMETATTDGAGTDALRGLRKSDALNRIYVIVLSKMKGESDKILAFEIGADDYITKPFSMKELVARINAGLRRTRLDKKPGSINVCGRLKLDVNRHEAYVLNKKIPLTAVEFNLVTFLAENKGWVFSREKLLARLWGGKRLTYGRTVDAHMKNIRHKLGKARELLVTIRGVGYKIDDSCEGGK